MKALYPLWSAVWRHLLEVVLANQQHYIHNHAVRQQSGPLRRCWVVVPNSYQRQHSIFSLFFAVVLSYKYWKVGSKGKCAGLLYSTWGVFNFSFFEVLMAPLVGLIENISLATLSISHGLSTSEYVTCPLGPLSLFCAVRLITICPMGTFSNTLAEYEFCWNVDDCHWCPPYRTIWIVISLLYSVKKWTSLNAHQLRAVIFVISWRVSFRSWFSFIFFDLAFDFFYALLQLTHLVFQLLKQLLKMLFCWD